MNTPDENRREDLYNRGYEPNPCKGCPNFEVVDWEGGTDSFCVIGTENCDREEGGQ